MSKTNVPLVSQDVKPVVLLQSDNQLGHAIEGQNHRAETPKVNAFTPHISRGEYIVGFYTLLTGYRYLLSGHTVFLEHTIFC